MKKAERDIRQAIIEKCRFMNAIGLNQGTSGNISARFEDKMLITPSATPYEALTPEMIAAMPFDGEYGAWEGPLKPSTEWRFHFDILKGRPDAGAVVHAHPTYCTVLAIARKPIPSVHYMMAAFGGTDVRCAPYATFGTPELSAFALQALDGRNACLLANHGSIAIGADLDKAMWLAVELETIARQYYMSLLIGGPVLLSDDDIAITAAAFGSYGVQDDHKKIGKPKRRASRKTAPARRNVAAKRATKTPAKSAGAKSGSTKAKVKPAGAAARRTRTTKPRTRKATGT